MNAQSEKQFTVSRSLEAPRDLVFKCWSEAERLAKWWGPKGFKMKVVKLDFRPGGAFHYAMASPDGKEMWGKIVYREIKAPERIVFLNSFSDAEGNLQRHFLNPNWPLEVLNTLVFEEANGKTTITLSGHPINATPEETEIYHGAHKSMQQGFSGTFNQLADYLKNANKEAA